MRPLCSPQVRAAWARACAGTSQRASAVRRRRRGRILLVEASGKQPRQMGFGASSFARLTLARVHVNNVVSLRGQDRIAMLGPIAHECGALLQQVAALVSSFGLVLQPV